MQALFEPFSSSPQLSNTQLQAFPRDSDSDAQQLADADPAGGQKGRVAGPPSCATIDGMLPEPPGSIARGRWAASAGSPGIRDALLYSFALSLVLLITLSAIRSVLEGTLIREFPPGTCRGNFAPDALEETISTKHVKVRQDHTRIARARKYAEFSCCLASRSSWSEVFLEKTAVALLGAAIWAFSLAFTCLLWESDALATGVAYAGGLIVPIDRRTVVYGQQAHRSGIRFILVGALFLGVLPYAGITIFRLGR